MRLAILFLVLTLSSCSSMVYTKTKFCIICWEQIVDSENNPHGENEPSKFFTPNKPSDAASAPKADKER